MTKYLADIKVMPHKALLDPQGKAVKSGLGNLGFNQVEDVRIGKHIQVSLEAATKQEAEAKVDEACRKMLANEIMEYYEFELAEVQG